MEYVIENENITSIVKHYGYPEVSINNYPTSSDITAKEMLLDGEDLKTLSLSLPRRKRQASK